jgi:hypothetical protein
MAGDWVKLEKETRHKEEILCIARACGVSRHEAFGAWFDLLCWLDSMTADGHLRALTPEECDGIGGLKGLGKAMADAGWIEFTPEGGAIVINWNRHNGASAKKRALTNRRVAACRGRSAQRTCNAGGGTAA